MSFSGKSVLITGATSDIGRATALMFAERGTNLMLTGRNREKLEKIEKEISSISTVMVQIQAQTLGYMADYAPLFWAVDHHFPGGIDFLVNLMGIWHCANRPLKGEDGWSLHNAVRHSFDATDEVICSYLHRNRDGGAIVNMSCHFVGVEEMADWGAFGVICKAIEALTVSRAISLQKKGRKIRVNCVAPTFVNTEPCRQMFPEEIAEGRAVTVEQVAEKIVWLCSHEATGINGEIIPILPI